MVRSVFYFSNKLGVKKLTVIISVIISIAIAANDVLLAILISQIVSIKNGKDIKK